MAADAETFDAARYVATLNQRPGVYRMYSARGELIYVGKAKNLRRRVASYFGGRARDAKTMALVEAIAGVEVTVTNTETEALLLEHTLIKEHRPRFNVILRDDKSYPWIYVNTDHDFPRLAFYRGPRTRRGKLFGPYPGAGEVRQTLNELQKLFLVRPCRDGFFANRTRPCLQYQINRCSAPCVGYISKAAYASDVANAMAFLEGRNQEVITNLAERMEQAADRLDYEQAARYRDQIARLRRIEAEQVVTGTTPVDVDAVAQSEADGVTCVAVVAVRKGRVMGSQSFFPKAQPGSTAAEIMAAFLGQYYLERDAPAEIVVDTEVEDAALFGESLSERQGSRVRVRHRVRGERARWVALAATNAAAAAGLRAAGQASVARQLEALAEALALADTPERIECFDISHTGGEAAVAACVVFGPDGPVKSDYRRFNMKGVAAGDDYAAIEEAVRRRYTRAVNGESPLPGLILIDGGKGQLARAHAALDALGLGELPVVGVAKGRARRSGSEQLFVPGERHPLQLGRDSPALLLIQNVRDEAHRFAITGHRQRRAKARRESPLEEIPGLGPKRRRELLRRFGGLQGVRSAGIEDLARTPGISRTLAEKIYNRFNPADTSSRALAGRTDEPLQ